MCSAARLLATSPPSRVRESLHFGEHCQQRVGSRNYYSIRCGCYVKKRKKRIALCLALLYCCLLVMTSLSGHSRTRFLSIVPSSVLLSWLSQNKIKLITAAHLLPVTLEKGKNIFLFSLRQTTQTDSRADMISFASKLKWHVKIMQRRNIVMFFYFSCFVFRCDWTRADEY